MQQLIGFLFISLFSLTAFSQVKRMDSTKLDSLNKEPFIQVVEQSLELFYKEISGRADYDSIINALNYEPGTVPTFSDDVYCERLEKINQMTPFQLDCTPAALSTIKFFAANRRSFARVVLGRSELYFDMFEEKLAFYGLPIELKYLSVIESGLRPQVKSRAGALGLWQFMYRTGLYYDLHENSYIDERMDPELATDAACRYLKKLFEIYNDWNLALAAYNAGPGNVNKAIRRSGGKTTYWEVRPFLPKETQGYVPNFIAATYLLTYHAEHNIVPVESKWNYSQLDTMCLKAPIHMGTISKLTGWEQEEIEMLNPIYKTSFIPQTSPYQCITGPLTEIGKLVSVEKDLYLLEDQLYGNGPGAQINVSESDNATDEIQVSGTGDTIEKKYYKYHTVRKGETVGKIADRFGVSVKHVMTLNNMKSTVLYVGQRIKIDEVSEEEANKPEPKETTQTSTATQKKYYSVRKGDTFSAIAQRHNVTQTQLRKLNPGINPSRLSIGQKIRIR
jgi:membrane-bound lytic murein transglycosylase D